MTSYPLGLPEVLREEFRYFFPDLPLTEARIRAEDVRELADLTIKLPLLAKGEGQTRWKILHDRALLAGRNRITGDSIVQALQGMLTRRTNAASGDDGWLLEQLMQDANTGPKIADAEVLHELLQVRGARRLVLEQPKLAEIVLEDERLLREFRVHSAAVRVLESEGFAIAFERYPALLSVIGDDEELNRALTGEKGPDHRRKLIETYAKQEPQGFFRRWMRRFGFVREEIDRSPELKMSATVLKQTLGLREAPETNRVESDPIDRILLSHFNATLLELAYAGHLADGHRLRALYEAVHDDERNLAALCLSGGGIRSATFNLGVLQGLADHRLLTRFHYLSTVSGGGYIGSWLSSWIRRHSEGSTGVAKDLSRAPIDPAKPEVEPIQHLRKYTSYLAPAAGALSVDTWTLVATYLRNLLLNWTMLLPLLVSILIVPRWLEAWTASSPRVEWIYVAIAAGIGAMLGVALARPLNDITARYSVEEGEVLRKQRRRSTLWLIPLLTACVLFVACWPAHHALFATMTVVKWVAGASALSALAFAVVRAIRNEPRSGWQIVKALFGWNSFVKRALVEISAAAAAGAVAGWLLATMFHAAFDGLSVTDPMGMALYICFAPALYLFGFFVEAALIVGFTTYSTSDHEREWWARSASLLFIAGVAHVVVSLCMSLLPHLLLQAIAFALSTAGASGALTWLLKRLLDGRKKDDASRSSRAAGILLKVSALVTLLLVISGVSLATTKIVGEMFGYRVSEHLVLLVNTPFFALAFLLAMTSTLSMVMSRLLNVNVYSMHRMYRNRLVRAYLGASRWNRHPDAFTGFDPEDDLPMWQLRPEALWRSSFLSLDAFIGAAPNQPWFGQLDDDLQNCVTTCGASTDPDERERLKTAILDGMNELLLTRDLAQNLETPRSAALLRRNREYLQDHCEGTLKNWDAAVLPTGANNRVEKTELFAKTAEQPTLKTAEQPIVETAEQRVVMTAEEPLDETEEQRVDERRHQIQRMRERLFRAAAKSVRPFARTPIHLVNFALNLVGGENLAWQERKADSFTVSPFRSGNHRLGYRDTAQYGGEAGISLGDSMAISGAAVSPNMGYNSSPIVTFLMTLFNARLGWWLGNPGDAGQKTYTHDSPESTLPYLVDEALGATTDADSYVFLSDGGHFDNLGLYEMVRRRCKYIVVCDASADGNFGFGDLGNAVRKIRIDLGIPIELTTKHIRAEAGEAAGRYCAIGTILYPDVDGYPFTKIAGEDEKTARRRREDAYQQRCGRLLYIKPAVYGDCPPDVRNYRTENNAFPHQTTVDQFFDESQFESYRALGRHAVGRMCRYTAQPQYGTPPWKAPNLPAFFLRAFNYIHEAKPAPGNAPVKTMKNVVEWMQVGISGDA